VDIARLKSSFARIAMHGDEVPLHFYADLVLKHPETRPLFPVSMQAQRAHLVEALVTIVSAVDDVHDLTAFLRDLGRGHRKFGALAEHYGAVGDSLLATFAYFCGEAWDAELEADWRGAYELIASVMTGAAREDGTRRGGRPRSSRRSAWPTTSRSSRCGLSPGSSTCQGSRSPSRHQPAPGCGATTRWPTRRGRTQHSTSTSG
jgi:hemoglobin-like flavoprotein